MHSYMVTFEFVRYITVIVNYLYLQLNYHKIINPGA
jgi:hypothetical protein